MGVNVCQEQNIFFNSDTMSNFFGIVLIKFLQERMMYKKKICPLWWCHDHLNHMWASGIHAESECRAPIQMNKIRCIK